jgi:hypothetical protein
MSEILRRLTRLTRAHLHDLWELRWGEKSAESLRDTGKQDNTETADRFSTPPFETRTNRGLPYSEELAGYYRTLDLPFGAPMVEVSKRWKTYLKKCHPDRYANDPEKQADATRLTQELTRAHENIKRAWDYYQPQG